MNKILKLAYAYIIASVFIGPGILALSVGDHPSGLDCGDSSWGNTAMSVRQAYFNGVATRMQIAASIMIFIGVVLLGLLLYKGIVSGQKWKAILATLGIVIMLLGYSLIAYIGAGGFC